MEQIFGNFWRYFNPEHFPDMWKFIIIVTMSEFLKIVKMRIKILFPRLRFYDQQSIHMILWS